jgi:hypothetical protein
MGGVKSLMIRELDSAANEPGECPYCGKPRVMMAPEFEDTWPCVECMEAPEADEP